MTYMHLGYSLHSPFSAVAGIGAFCNHHDIVSLYVLWSSLIYADSVCNFTGIVLSSRCVMRSKLCDRLRLSKFYTDAVAKMQGA